ncbi:MAG: amino acid permease [Bdellovibrionales bacterium]|nr:amino acid permease [Bdellovibrionales bacterium]
MTKTHERPLGRVELIAIAIGGMIGGGIFSILGVSAEMVGNATPIAILVGGVLAYFAAYSYAKLATYYEDEGATYSFFKLTFTNQKYLVSVVGWLIVFGYMSTLALYAFTFSSYFSSLVGIQSVLGHKLVALLILAIFTLLNLFSVNGMGKVEDAMVYTKVVILLVISGLFIRNGDMSLAAQFEISTLPFSNIFTVAAITFVAYEGFQLVIHAYKETESPKVNVPSAIYWSIGVTTVIYFVLSLGAVFSIPTDTLIRDKEFALAAGTSDILGPIGYGIVIVGALLATSSAINGTLFGASRLMAVISEDGALPKAFSKRWRGLIPYYSILGMGVCAYLFILSGGLKLIIEFGSITFILVSFLMALTNFKIRDRTQSGFFMTLTAMLFLGLAGVTILVYEAETDENQLIRILGIYVFLALSAKLYIRRPKDSSRSSR